MSGLSGQTCTIHNLVVLVLPPAILDTCQGDFGFSMVDAAGYP